MEGGQWRTEGGGRRTEGGGWRTEGGGWTVEGGGWRVEELMNHRCRQKKKASAKNIDIFLRSNMKNRFIVESWR